VALAYKPSQPAKRTIAKLEAAEERRQQLISIAQRLFEARDCATSEMPD
jgi:hypothetical protein